MKKILALAIATLLLFMVGCSANGGGNEGGGGETPIVGEQYVLKGIIKAVNDEIIEVEVIESDYAYGIYWVHTDSATLLDVNGNTIAINDFSIDDIVNITYSGQTALSYPPQIFPYKIQKV